MPDEQITKWTDEEIISLVSPDLEKAKLLQDTLSTQRTSYYDRYRCEAYGNEREGFSKSVAPVIHDNHKWTMANLMEIFTEDFFVLKGDNPEKAEKLQKLIFYQMFRKQDGFKKLYDFIWNCNLYHYGVLKCYYKEDYDLVTDTHAVLSLEQLAELMANKASTVTKFTEEEDEEGARLYTNVKIVTKKVKYAGPIFSAVPVWEFFYSPDCKITDWGAIEGRMIVHKTKTTLNEIRKKEKAKVYRAGTYEKVKEKHLEPFSDPEDKTEILFNVDEIPATEDADLSEDKENFLNKEVSVDECYFMLDIDNDGLLEPVIVDLCDDVVCRVIENPYGRPCFRLGHISPEPHKVVGEATPQFLDNDQKIQTNLIRLVQDSAALDCYKNPVTNDHQMFTLLQDRKPFAVIKGDPQKLGEVKTSTPSDFILKALEMCEASVEKKTGMTRYNQGMDASSLNKTATGIDAIMAASAKPLRMVAKILGTGAIMGLIRDFIFINQLYPPQTDIQILGTDITVNPDDLTGEHEIEIDIGVSTAEKQSMANQIDLLVQFATQAGIPMGIMTPLHVMKAQRKKYKYLGVNVDDLLVSEKEFMANQEKAKQNPPKPDIKEYVQLDKLFPLLTPMEQSQIVETFGIQPDPRRKNMPPDALSGQTGPLGGPPQQDAAVTPGHQENLHRAEMASNVQSMKHAEETHRQGLAHAQEKHLTDLRIQQAKTAFDMKQKAQRPYPKGVERK